MLDGRVHTFRQPPQQASLRARALNPRHFRLLQQDVANFEIGLFNSYSNSHHTRGLFTQPVPKNVPHTVRFKMHRFKNRSRVLAVHHARRSCSRTRRRRRRHSGLRMSGRWRRHRPFFTAQRARALGGLRSVSSCSSEGTVSGLF
jgi:hypothetical protein